MSMTHDQFVADVPAVYIGNSAKGSFGSGRLIAPGLILTAGHVVDYPTRDIPTRDVAYPVVPGRRRCGMPDGMSRRERRRRGRRWRGRDRLASSSKPSLTRGAAPCSYSSDAGRAALSAPPVAAGERQRSNAAPTLMNASTARARPRSPRARRCIVRSCR